MNFLYILLAILLLLVLITVHEFGHYTAGKLLKFKINEFSIGFGKAIFTRTNPKTGEKFSIRIFPLGGYCAFEGEDEDGKNNPDAFNNQKAWKRLIVLFAGVFANFVFGIMSAIVFLFATGYSVPKLAYVLPDSPNAIVLQVGDEIEKVNGKSIEAYRDLSELVSNKKAGQKITLTIRRNGKLQKVIVTKYENADNWYVQNINKISTVYHFDGETLTAYTSEEEVVEAIKANNGELKDLFYNEKGVAYSETQISELLGLVHATKGTSLGILFNYAHRNYGYFEAVGKAFPFCFKICWLILSALGGLFTGATKLKDMGGTITAISQVAQYSKLGFNVFLYMIPMLSMNLALFNFLPIPALDGARFVFVLIEMIFKKPVPRKVEAIIHTVGLFVLLGLVIFLDIFHFFIA